MSVHDPLLENHVLPTASINSPLLNHDLDLEYNTQSSIATLNPPTPPFVTPVPKGRLIHRIAAFAMVFPLFATYASLVTLQHKLKDLAGIPDDEDHATRASLTFSFLVSLVYFGNLFFRLGHNLVFAWASARQRVLISLSAAMSSMSLLAYADLVHGHATLTMVGIAYGLGGIAVGTFEANLLHCLTPFGASTKQWAVLAMPLGFITISFGGFLAFSRIGAAMRVGYIYLGVAVLLALSVVLFMVLLYRGAAERRTLTVGQVLQQVRDWRSWLPTIAGGCGALFVDMFTVSLFSPGVILYIYDAKLVPMSFTHYKMSSDTFKAVYDFLFSTGDTLSRKLFYNARPVRPHYFLAFSLGGMVAGLCGVTELVLIAGFFVAFANGAIYAQTTKNIHANVDPHNSLVALSTWLFVGDCGSVLGSNLISVIAPLGKRLDALI